VQMQQRYRHRGRSHVSDVGGEEVIEKISYQSLLLRCSLRRD
jgi:hypothetical protein